MTTQLSRERLEEKLLEHIKNGGDSEEETMIRMLLAGMDSEPVAYIGKQMLESLCDEGGRTCGRVWRSDTDELSGESRIPLYTAPTAPVAVTDEMPESAYEILYKAMGAKACFIADDLWNACRTAMLKAGPVTAAAVPDGWKLVPVDPTMPQELAGHKTLSDTGKMSRLMKTRISNIYRAMLAAAPAAPEQEV